MNIIKNYYRIISKCLKLAINLRYYIVFHVQPVFKDRKANSYIWCTKVLFTFNQNTK